MEIEIGIGYSDRTRSNVKKLFKKTKKQNYFTYAN